MASTSVFYSRGKKNKNISFVLIALLIATIIGGVSYYLFNSGQQVAVQQEAGGCVEGKEEVRKLCASCSPRVAVNVLYKCVNGKMVRWKNVGTADVGTDDGDDVCSHCPPEPPKPSGTGGSTTPTPPPPTLVKDQPSGYCPMFTEDGRVLVGAYYDEKDGGKKKCIYGPPGKVDKNGNIKEDRVQIVLDKSVCDEDAIKTCASYGGSCRVINGKATCVDCTGHPIRTGGACGPSRLGVSSRGVDCQCYECVQQGGQYRWVIVDDVRCGGSCGSHPNTPGPTPSPTPTPTPTTPTPTPTTPPPTLTPTEYGDLVVEKVYAGECKTGSGGEYEEVTYMIRIRYPEDPDFDLAPITVDNVVDTYDSTIDADWITSVSDGGRVNSAEHTITWDGFTLSEGQIKVLSYTVNYPADVFEETFLNTVRVTYTVGEDPRTKEDTVSLTVRCMTVTVPSTGVLGDNPALTVLLVFIAIWVLIFLDKNYNIFVPLLLKVRIRTKDAE